MISQTKYHLEKAKVLENNEILPDTFILSFKRTFEFLPGQVIAITTNNNISPRLYSIASGDSDSELEILYDVKSEGELTPKLSRLKKGDMLFYSLPFGEFVDNKNPSYWIATGTGVAPFVSMIRSGLYEHKKLIHGARDEQFFYFEELFKIRLVKNYIQCCSQCGQEQRFQGRLTLFLKQDNNLSLNEKFYLCGSAEMVVDVRDILIGKGVAFNNIISEIYF